MQLTKPKEHSDDKPSKYEVIHFLKTCSRGCPNCDKKRIGTCQCR